MWGLYKAQPAFVLGFHGCDEAIGEAVLRSSDGRLNASYNEYDWIGWGTYFWEGSPQRALEFADQAKIEPRVTKGRIKTPFVVGAIIDLGLCCNLVDSSALQELAEAFASLKAAYSKDGLQMPRNLGGPDRRARYLDCAVIEFMHVLREEAKLPPYDSVRAPLLEGDDLYPSAGFKRKNHIQIAVRNPACIKGYFRPIRESART